MPPPGSDPTDAPVPARASRPAVRGSVETERVLSVFGSNTRRGAWEPAERVEALSIFGAVTLDLRDARVYDETHIQCLCLFGSVEVLVPPDVEVDAHGAGIFGGFEERRRAPSGARVVKAIGRALRGEAPEEEPTEEEAAEDPPLVVVRGLALFGGVTVKIG